ncbi:MAG: hypothetical protein JWQ87_2033 [Candidatus Sulfotelmatobacter sp.]|nr:hypothetical protein [Candidatus Sulfotelmatobacter sp.]
MKIDDYIKGLACETAVREEERNGANGMLGVLFLLRRRAQTWYGGDWFKAITTHGQFSSMTILGDARTVYYGDPREPKFAKVLDWVDSIFSGVAEDKLTGGGLYYADLSSPKFEKGGWFDRNILQKPDEHGRCAQIGSTTYFL